MTHLVAQADASDVGLGSLGGIGLVIGVSRCSQAGEVARATCGPFRVLLASGEPAGPEAPFAFGASSLQPRRASAEKAAERFGGFGSQRGLGVMFWLLANIVDCMIAGDTTGAEEMAALALMAVEQASQDAGSWEVAYLLTLMEDPPHQLFQHRPQSQNPRLRAFGGLTPQPWVTTTLAYIKEIDAIQSRRGEAMGAAKPKPSTQPPPSGQDQEVPPKPRRARFPRKPKDGPPA